jgi:tRNA/tmRNA/rRNA uracil-C5-methylase (TrmA/RlmC/RlmD family)
MTFEAGTQIEVAIEKPAAGGRMIARHGGQVVLVQGAIPGERVRARITRSERQVAFAETVQVIEPSLDRRAATGDPLCGGCVYAHVAYPRQLSLKAEVIHDAFVRLGRIPFDRPTPVAASPGQAYRMRARLHVRGRRLGFYREGTHELCDPRPTAQLADAAVDAAEAAVASLDAAGCAVASVELTENIAATERAAYLTLAPGPRLTQPALDDARTAGALTGCTAAGDDGTVRTSGVPVVADPLDVLTQGRGRTGSLQRHAESFFQANRFLLPQLVTAVLDAVPADGDVLDLYAGVGLFSMALASTGRRAITAVEGDRAGGRDLQQNAAAQGGAVRVWIDSVEDYLKRHRTAHGGTIVVDPPRTGISKEAMGAIITREAGRIVYVSCDPPTMARDARRLLDGGYRLASLQAFDLFPNTPHVESIGVFDR